MPVEVVVVGDRDLDPGVEAVVAAAREAMTNAAKFGDGSAVDVYAESSDGRTQVFIRDRGPGFDSGRPPAGPARRARVDRGPDASVTAAEPPSPAPPGAGTEVELLLEDGSVSSPRVLIVDDHQLFRSGVRAELESLLEVVGEAGGVERGGGGDRGDPPRRGGARRAHAGRRRRGGDPPHE